MRQRQHTYPISDRLAVSSFADFFLEWCPEEASYTLQAAEIQRVE